MEGRVPLALALVSVLAGSGGACTASAPTRSAHDAPTAHAESGVAAAGPPRASPGGYAASESALPSAKAAVEAPPAGSSLTLAEARRYMLKLINRDRASAGLAPVELDEGAPTRAGQAHADDMARNGYLGHWGTDGSVPEERFTEAGGADMVLENSSCFTDEKRRTLDRAPRIDPRNVEQSEDMFFHEQPPHDGHRKNILKPWHRRVGIGVAQPLGTPTEIPVPCFAQEFVDPYGAYGAVPRTARVGDSLHVQGTVASPAKFAGVGLARVDAPKPIDVGELNQRRSYPVPTPYEMYWPPGFQTRIPVRVVGSRFDVDVPLGDKDNRAGMYEVSVWASFSGSEELVMIGLRTIQVR
jgi:uncharacterized protein YkwD